MDSTAKSTRLRSGQIIEEMRDFLLDRAKCFDCNDRTDFEEKDLFASRSGRPSPFRPLSSFTRLAFSNHGDALLPSNSLTKLLRAFCYRRTARTKSYRLFLERL